jgi:DNA-binding PadR family transcriptional regulator
MTRRRQLRDSKATRRVLTVLLTGARNIGGYTIWHLTGGSSGGVYVVLDRLEHNDPPWITAEWEVLPDGVDRPRRRYYRLTPWGRQRALRLLGLEES